MFLLFELIATAGNRLSAFAKKKPWNWFKETSMKNQGAVPAGEMGTIILALPIGRRLTTDEYIVG